MSKNDAIVLKANFETWVDQRASDLGQFDPWLYYCTEQFLKPYSLDDEELQSGLTDGGGDGGIDATYFLTNHSQLITEDSEIDAQNVSKIRLIFIQVKESGGFRPTEIEKLIETTNDFFDLSKPADSFGTRYSEDIVRAMRSWKTKLIKLASSFPDLIIDYYYITGEDTVPDDYALDAGERVKSKALHHNKKAKCEFHYIGAEDLWNQVQRRPPKSRPLKWSETPMVAQEGHVGLVGLKDYYEFIQDSDGVLAERIFESNVRGWQKDVNVNKQIRKTLKDNDSGTNFWVLNNGITIISPKVNTAGHHILSIEDPQIVNGLQTSREIFNHFSEGIEADDSRSLLVRVIETNEPKVHDQIVRATNSQNILTESQLRMTDQIHKDIEEVFKKLGWFYDRRKGYYKDQGKPIRRIISVEAVAQAAIAILLQKPNDARARPGNYFKNNEKYNSIFAEGKYPLSVYLTCAHIVSRAETFLREKGNVKR